MDVTIDHRNLQVIPPTEWPILRDLYKQNWPENITTYYTLQNYIEWLTKNPATNDIHVYSIDANWRQHGTYILEDRNKLRYNVLFNTLSAENQHLMLSALQRLESNAAFTLTSYVDRVKPAVMQYLYNSGVKEFSTVYCPTVLYYMPKEQSLKLKLKPLDGFIVKPLTEDLVDQIDNLWPHQYPGSDYFIQRVIRYNLTYGVFDSNTHALCAWAMHLEIGTIGLLQVEEKYKRRGLGSHLVGLLARKLAELNIDATATIMDKNIPSRNMFEKFGFRIIDRVYWYDKLPSDTTIVKSNSDASLKHG